MEGVGVGFKDHQRVEARKDSRLRSGHVLRPQLEVPAVLLGPVAVQIEQGVDPPFEAEPGMREKVPMNEGETIPRRLMEPAAHMVWIRDKTADSGQRLEEVEKW